MSSTVQVDVGGHSLALSNLDKVLYPTAGTTKAEVIDYYARVAPVLLPHLADRAVTLRRFPDGVEGGSFYEKNCPGHRPDWVGTHPVTSDEDATIDFCRLDSVAALTWVANLAALELHTSMARAVDSRAPTMVVFDLDPGAPAALLDCAEVGLWIQRVLEGFGLTSLIKTSGSKGMQLYLPLNSPTTYEATSGFARTVAQLLEREAPDQVVSVQRKDRRGGKVLVDWSQNSWHKTTACVYSLRARERPTVSTPVTWDEVDDAVAAGDPRMLTFETADVLERVEHHGDLFADVATLEQELPES
ncbi:MAG TPA: non-homologous end-joining DNA ligase [Acidimicrobiales bacterium]|nr:non-homologous end-joining DNA ligase [Acidimicrobiales bacterium]